MRIGVEVVDVSSLQFLYKIPTPSMLFRKLTVVRELGIKASDQQNVENLMSIACLRTLSGSFLPLAKRAERQTSTMGVIVIPLRPTRILKSIKSDAAADGERTLLGERAATAASEPRKESQGGCG